jgi:uncharacterized membrane protein
MSRIEVQRALLKNRELDKILSIMKASNLSVSDIEGRIQEKNESPSDLDSFVKKRQERNWTRNMRKNARKGREVKARKKEERNAKPKHWAKGETKPEAPDREECEQAFGRAKETAERAAAAKIADQRKDEGEKPDVNNNKEV